MVLAMSRPWKHPKTGVYYFRKGVPEGMRFLVKKREVKFTLGTKDPVEAKRLNAIATAAVAAEWAKLIAQADRPPVALTQQQIVALSGKLYQSIIDEHGANPGKPGVWEARIREMQIALPERLRTSKASTFFQGWFFTVEPQAQLVVGHRVGELLKHEGLTVDWETRIKLCLAGATAVAQAYRELEKRANDDYRPDPDAARFPEWQPLGQTAAVAPSAGLGSPSLPWGEVYNRYAGRKTNPPGPATVKRQRGVITAFFAFLGHDDMKRVTGDDVERWVEHRLEHVSDRTVRDADLAHPKTLFIFAKKKKLISHLPFDGITVDVGKKTKLRAREFSLEEVERILAASLVPASKRMTVEGAAARRWVPWLCAYSGARVNEITQARALDVAPHKSRNGQTIWCINITPDAGSVKTHEARLVALHPHLIEQGFLRYVKSRKGKHLFYDPARGRDGSSANPQYKKAGERLARWVRSKDVGVTDIGVDPNHGWRHLFRSSMLAAKIDGQIIDRIDGHASATVGQTYGTAWPEVMLEAISKIAPYRVGGAS